MRGKSPTTKTLAAPPTHAGAARDQQPFTTRPPAENGRQDGSMVDDGLVYHVSDRWAEHYPGVEVAVITSLEKPPSPPEGFVPLRLGVHRQYEADGGNEEDEEMEGFSVDTLLWNEELLESRLDDLMAWTRREPLSLRQKLDRINWLVNSV